MAGINGLTSVTPDPNEEARQMYEDALAKNTLYQGMKERWDARQAARSQGIGDSIGALADGIANAALKNNNVAGGTTTGYGVMATTRSGNGYQGS